MIAFNDVYKNILNEDTINVFEESLGNDKFLTVLHVDELDKLIKSILAPFGQNIKLNYTINTTPHFDFKRKSICRIKD